MAAAFKFDLVSPERLLASEEATAVTVPATDGEMTVMALHAPTMTTLRPGVVKVTRAGGGQENYVVFGGFADIMPDSCTVLAVSATRVADIDRADLERRIQSAREDVNDARDHDARSKAEEYLSQLTTLHGAILPA